MKKNKEVLHGWLFHFNPYKSTWHAFRREDADDYFNGNLINPIEAKKHSKLVKYIRERFSDEKSY